jgi:hypothetical protein
MIFEDSAIGLDKWLVAVCMLTNCTNGISGYEVARDLGVTQKTAWFMMHRVRSALQDKEGTKAGESGSGRFCAKPFLKSAHLKAGRKPVRLDFTLLRVSNSSPGCGLGKQSVLPYNELEHPNRCTPPGGEI